MKLTTEELVIIVISVILMFLLSYVLNKTFFNRYKYINLIRYSIAIPLFAGLFWKTIVSSITQKRYAMIALLVFFFGSLIYAVIKEVIKLKTEKQQNTTDI